MPNKFNICVPVLNQHQHTLAMLQNFCKTADDPQRFCWVLVDNGSTPALETFLEQAELPDAIRRSISIITYPQNIGLTKALNAGYRFICENQALSCDYIFFSHNDVLMDEKGWDSKVGTFLAKDAPIGVVGFGGARQIGMKELYRAPYHISQLRRRDFISNMREADVHGKRMTAAFEPIAVLDGFSLIVNMNLLQETGGFDEKNYPIHHLYDIDICLEALRRWRMNYVLNIKCHHCGAVTSTNADYNTWSQPHGGDLGIHAAAHLKFYEKWRGFIPLRVTPSRSPVCIAKKGMQNHIFSNAKSTGRNAPGLTTVNFRNNKLPTSPQTEK